MRQLILITVLITLFSQSFFGQTPEPKELTREAVLEMNIGALSDLPLDDLMKAMDLLGVSSMDELYALILNKNVQSASKRSENAFDSPLSSSVLTKDEILTYGATTIEEAMRLIPGVIVREKTNGNFDIHLRGLDNVVTGNMLLYSENTNILLMVDGRPMFNYAHGAMVWESLPIGFEDIDRIEVVRGPSSALYGSNAVNGVINIITAKTTSTSPIVSGSINGGTQNTYTGDIAIRKSYSNKFSAAITGNFQSRRRASDDIYFYGTDYTYIKNTEDNTYSKFNGGFLPIDEYKNIFNYYQPYNAYYPSLIATETVEGLFPNVGLSRENAGLNGYFQYSPSNTTQVSLAAGYQDSYVNSTPVGDLPTTYSGRESNTAYFNLNASVGKLKLQTNYNGGAQEFAVGKKGFKVDMGQFNASAEYDYQLKALNLRPGVSYQNVVYNDMPYLEVGDMGYLNGKKELNTLSLSLRADYLAFSKLRLVGAFRSEKYNNPDKWYHSWQLAGTLPINNNNTVRAVYSRANRSSFIVNTHSDYIWDRTAQMPPTYIHFNGTNDHELMTMDNVELGYRVRPAKSLLVDSEIFYSKSKNYGALLPGRSAITNINQILGGQAPISEVFIAYLNTPLEATQLGASINIDWVITKKLIAKVHATVQKTTLDNYASMTRNEIMGVQLGQATQKLQTLAGGVMGGTIPLPLTQEQLNSATSSYQPTTEDNVKHTNTPDFWGMAGLVYKPITKLDISSYGYYYGSQTMVGLNGDAKVDSKFILNLKVAYKPIAKTEVYVNAKNLLNNKSNEFAYMDEIGGIYMVGVRFDF